MKKHSCSCGWSSYYPNVRVTKKKGKKYYVAACPECDSEKLTHD